jgi:hypothetical protein
MILKKIGLILLILLAILAIIFAPKIFPSKHWINDDIHFETADGFKLNAYLLHPKNPTGKMPAIACLHQLSGNRDDFLKLFPYFADAGIVAIAPDFPRQQPNFDPKRISDLRDTIGFLEELEYVDSERLGIITASFSVETGLVAIRNKPNVIADVMISGPVLREASRKWISLNSNLAIFTIASVYDGNHYLLYDECLARSLNPFSRKMFIKKKEAPFVLPAHGTFVFDEIPESLPQIQKFFMDVFGIAESKKQVIENLVPKNMIAIEATDGMPIYATFRQPVKNGKAPAIILYPPEFLSRTFYNSLIDELVSSGIAVLSPNTKRACRKLSKIPLCEREVNGAINFLTGSKNIDASRIAVLFPSFYYLYAKRAIENREIPVKVIFLMDLGKINYGINPRKIRKNGYEVYYLNGANFKKLQYILKKRL